MGSRRLERGSDLDLWLEAEILTPCCRREILVGSPVKRSAVRTWYQYQAAVKAAYRRGQQCGLGTNTKLPTLAMMLKRCKIKGDLPLEGDILNLFECTDDACGKVIDITAINDIVHFTGTSFYVRKEILCVLENFMKIYQLKFDTGDLVNKQFILMGSPGTGKSCILALICSYIAIHNKRPVVWFREVDGGTSNGVDPWFGLDGMVYNKIKEKCWLTKYKLLATSGQFSPKSEALEFIKMCLVPYWKQTDLEDFGLNHLGMLKSVVDDRFFASGGSLEIFSVTMQQITWR
ncbi:unnamed protein product [Phytophthora lilii]|uniref:Unnamed protein product n=1 Tax=Phytophthora lilii TaxID=2077276 RepID=A0A9W7D9Z3_9STRA|nr:unnamed protein product [Phytophthora lilii]